MHLAVPSLTEGLHCSALHLTGLDSTAIDLYGPRLCWIEMYLAGRERMELDGNEQYWTRRAQNPLNELDRTSVEWTGLD